MCRDCGCGDPEIVPIEIQTKILAGNDATAKHNREHLASRGILAINMMGSPGSGKTAVLERTAAEAKDRYRISSITADLATDRDAERLRRAGIPSTAITTGTACHLDARLVHNALHDMDLEGVGVLFIENVGNLVCPAVYDLGEAFNVVALSVTEGEDKPLKYPTMFHKADLVLITKTDLVPHLDVCVDDIRDALARVMPERRCMTLSAKTGEGFGEWLEWLETKRSQAAAVVSSPPNLHHHDHDHDDGHRQHLHHHRAQ